MELRIVIKIPTLQQMQSFVLKIFQALLFKSNFYWFSILVHAGLFLTLYFLKTSQGAVSSGQSNPIKVSLNRSQVQSQKTISQKVLPQKTLAQPSLKKSSSPKEAIAISSKSFEGKKLKILQPEARKSSKNEEAMPEDNKKNLEQKEFNPNSVDIAAPQRNSKLYPSENLSATQQSLGSDSGSEDLPDSPKVTESETIVDAGPVRNKIVETEYSSDDYKMKLSRQFAEAWGPVRTLPYGSFVGSIGELIEYEVWLNRDGSLVKVVNLSQLRNPYRDFKAVDELVERFYDIVTPMAPIPDRIKTVPFRLRMSLRYGGLNYSW
jgi:hypothetical protein